MNKKFHKTSLWFFSVLPIAFALLGFLVLFYHDGYYIETDVSFGVGFENITGSFYFNSSGPLPEGYELVFEGDKVMLWGPPPEGTEVHMDFVEYYTYVARPTKLFLDSLFDPYFNTKLFMKSLQENLVYVGIVIVIAETIFNGLSRKYDKPTVIHVYKIDIISIKILHFVRDRNKSKED